MRRPVSSRVLARSEARADREALGEIPAPTVFFWREKRSRPEFMVEALFAPKRFASGRPEGSGGRVKGLPLAFFY